MQQRTKNKLWKMWKHAAKTQGNNGKYEKKNAAKTQGNNGKCEKNAPKTQGNYGKCEKMQQRLKEIVENVDTCSKDSRK